MVLAIKVLLINAYLREEADSYFSQVSVYIEPD